MYSERVIELFQQSSWRLKGSDETEGMERVFAQNPVCGDTLELCCREEPSFLGYRCEGCLACFAVAEGLCCLFSQRHKEGRSLEISRQELGEYVGILPENKKHAMDLVYRCWQQLQVKCCWVH